MNINTIKAVKSDIVQWLQSDYCVGKEYGSVSEVLTKNDATDVETLIGKFNTVNDAANWQLT